MVLFIGGPDDGKHRDITHMPVRHGAIFSTFVDRPMSADIAARVVNGDERAIATHAALDRFDYRCVLFRCEDVDRFVAIDNSLPDAAALVGLIAGYRP